MGCECSKIKVCSICNEVCETYICVLKLKEPYTKTVCCLSCVTKLEREIQKGQNTRK